MWARRGPEQIQKCAEASSRRIAFPEELGSLYLYEELEKSDVEPTTPVAPTVVEPPKITAIPEINHMPAEIGSALRPNATSFAPMPVESF
jgi:hypothetical protein